MGASCSTRCLKSGLTYPFSAPDVSSCSFAILSCFVPDLSRASTSFYLRCACLQLLYSSIGLDFGIVQEEAINIVDPVFGPVPAV